MNLYVYDHCPFCAKARMIFGLKNEPLDLHFVLEDDVETPTRLVGKKTTPIIEKQDGSHIAESMDIVHYVDGLQGEAIVKQAAEDSAIKAAHDALWKPVLQLSIPRLSKVDLPEFATAEARAAFVSRQTRNFGDFDELIARSAELISEVEAGLATLDPLLAGREGVDTDDFLLYPTLRMLSVVKGVNYPANVQAYMESMQASTGVKLHTAQAI